MSIYFNHSLPAALGTAGAPSIAFVGDSNTGIYSPGADQLAISTGGTDRLFVASDGKVGIGTGSPNAFLDVASASTSTLSANITGPGETYGTGNSAYSLYSPKGTLLNISGTTATTGNTALVYFSVKDLSGNTTGAYLGVTVGSVVNGAANLVFGRRTAASTWQESARIDASGRLLVGTNSSTANGGVLQVSNGITFPATQSACADANTLDDYEEGTFTPTIVGTGTAGTGTYSVQVGRYTRVGHRVDFQINLTWSAHTGTTNMIVGGLPFTSANVTNVVSPVAIRHSNLASPASSVVQGFVTTNATTITLESVAVAGGASAALTIDTAATLTLTGTYEVA